MQTLTSAPSFLRDRPAWIGDWVRHARDAVVSNASWPARAFVALRALSLSARGSVVFERVSCPRAERAWFAAAIVAVYALVGVLGFGPAAAPLVLGGVGLALMIAWIGWYWPDEA
jgi:hypothetical protein